jgi:hypothetical protein
MEEEERGVNNNLSSHSKKSGEVISRERERERFMLASQEFENIKSCKPEHNAQIKIIQKLCPWAIS